MIPPSSDASQLVLLLAMTVGYVPSSRLANQPMLGKQGPPDSDPTPFGLVSAP